MTIPVLIETLEETYCEVYPKALRAILVEYLGQYDDRLRGSLFRVVLLRYSRQYGKAPGLSVFEDCLEEAKASLVENLPALTYDEVPSEEDKAEVERLIKEARGTPVGRFLLRHLRIGKEAS